MKEVLILGAGVAGLTAGIYALKRGLNVTICEQHSVAGGNLTGWKRKGFHIDNCIHWLTGTNKNSILHPLWKDSGVLSDDIAIVQEEKLFTYEEDGKTVALWSTIEKTVENMLEVAPEDEKEIKAFGKMVKLTMGLDKTGGKNFNRWINPVELLKIIPGLKKYHNMTVAEYGETFKSPCLKKFFCCLTPADFSAMAFFYIAASFCSGNAALPEGGSFPAAQRMAKTFKELGGKLLTRKKAVKVNVEKDKVKSVEMEDGSVYEADAVISTIDPATFFGKLIDRPMPKAMMKMYTNRAFERFSAVQGAYACDIERLPFEGTFIMKLPEYAKDVFQGDTIVFREFTHERSNSPEGKNIVQFMTYLDEEGSKEYIELEKNAEEYEKREELLQKTALRILSERFPGIDEHLECIDVWTPASYKRYTGADVGSFMSFSMPKKILPVSLGCKIKIIKNLFIATQWQTPPGGLPLAAKAGRLAARSIKV